MDRVLTELKGYVGFRPADEATLRAFHPLARSRFDQIGQALRADAPHSASADAACLAAGDPFEQRVKGWLDRLLGGPWDQGYFEERRRLVQMDRVAALQEPSLVRPINTVRQHLELVIDDLERSPVDERALREAVGGVLDLELAIWLHGFCEDFLLRCADEDGLSALQAGLGNPAVIIASSLFVLRARQNDTDGEVSGVPLRAQFKLADQVIGGLLEALHERPLFARPTSLGRVIRLAAATCAESEVSLHGVEALPRVNGDIAQLGRVFEGLLRSSSLAAGESGGVEVSGRADGSWVSILVKSIGSDSHRERPFAGHAHPTRPIDPGPGLGPVKRIVERHCGTLSYEAEGGRVRYEVRLPRFWAA